MDFDKIPYVIAQKAAHDRPWPPPASLSCEACKRLSGGGRVPMPEVIKLMAFGPAMSPAEYSDSSVEAMTTSLVAAYALFRAAGERKVSISGERCERSTHAFLDGLPRVRLIEPFGKRPIPAAEFAGDGLTLSPVNMNWICLASVAAKPELWAWPDGWRHAGNACYFNVEIDRASLSKWIGEETQTRARYRSAKRELILKSADELGPVLDGLSVQERDDRILKKAVELSGGKRFTADAKTIREALRVR